MQKLNRLYVIDWYVNGFVKQTINLNSPKTIVLTKSHINKLKSTHKDGLLVRRCINKKEVIQFNNAIKGRLINKV